MHTRVVAGGEFGALEDRKRLCVVAVTRGIEFDFEDLEVPMADRGKVADILDPIAADDPCWSPLAYLREKEARDLAAGKNFRMQTVEAEDTMIPTISRGTTSAVARTHT